ncbi:MAG: STAS domain-containing protein [Gammaproteobacteria bacterium]
MLTISSAHQDGVLIVNLAGRIDAANAKDLEQQCLQWIENGETRIIFDFSAVNYISSAALRVFLLVAKRLGSVNGSVRLCGLNTTLRDVFDISGFSKLFTITTTLQEALAA